MGLKGSSYGDEDFYFISRKYGCLSWRWVEFREDGFFVIGDI